MSDPRKSPGSGPKPPLEFSELYLPSKENSPYSATTSRNQVLARHLRHKNKIALRESREMENQTQNRSPHESEKQEKQLSRTPPGPENPSRLK